MASGFALLIIIAMALGSMAIWNMDKVGNQATTLGREYVPEGGCGHGAKRGCQWRDV